MYDAARARAPPVTQKMIKAREREFDPVLGVFRDPGREASEAAKDREASIVASNKGKDKQLRVSQRFNIINHRSVVDDDPLPPPKAVSQTYRSRVGYNIISNEPFSDHHFDAPKLRPPAETGDAPKAGKIEHASMARDYDIISGKYLEDHESKTAVDQDVALKRAAGKWWETRDFDPIRGRFYDATKDERDREAEAEAQRTVQVRREKALPPSERLKETAGYDPVLHRVTDEEKLRQTDAKHHRPLVKHVRAETEKRLMEEGQADYALKDRRTVRRAGLRLVKDLPDKRSYDVITGAPLRGVDSADARVAEQLELMHTVAHMEAVAGRSGRAAAVGTHSRLQGAVASTNQQPWAARTGGTGVAGAMKGVMPSGMGSSAEYSVQGVGSLGTSLGAPPGGVGFGVAGGLAATASAVAHTLKPAGLNQTELFDPSEDVLMTTSAAAQGIGCKPSRARVRPSDSVPSKVKLAGNVRKGPAHGDAWKKITAMDAKAPPSTRVRRPGR
jgi:hypothetical protein